MFYPFALNYLNVLDFPLDAVNNEIKVSLVNTWHPESLNCLLLLKLFIFIPYKSDRIFILRKSVHFLQSHIWQFQRSYHGLHETVVTLNLCWRWGLGLKLRNVLLNSKDVLKLFLLDSIWRLNWLVLVLAMITTKYIQGNQR